MHPIHDHFDLQFPLLFLVLLRETLMVFSKSVSSVASNIWNKLPSYLICLDSWLLENISSTIFFFRSTMAVVSAISAGLTLHTVHICSSTVLTISSSVQFLSGYIVNLKCDFSLLIQTVPQNSLLSNCATDSILISCNCLGLRFGYR